MGVAGVVLGALVALSIPFVPSLTISVLLEGLAIVVVFAGTGSVCLVTAFLFKGWGATRLKVTRKGVEFTYPGPAERRALAWGAEVAGLSLWHLKGKMYASEAFIENSWNYPRTHISQTAWETLLRGAQAHGHRIDRRKPLFWASGESEAVKLPVDQGHA